MKVTFSKVLGGDRIRSSIVEGTCDKYPELGVPFVMTAEPLDPSAGFRLVNTSPVCGIGYELDGSITITTQNSTYRLLITEET